MVQVLTVNAGSSSLRLVLLRHAAGRWERVYALHRDGAQANPTDVLREMLEHGGNEIGLVGHRIVHGGQYNAPRLIDGEVEERIEHYSAYAPLHNPPALRCLRAVRSILDPGIPHVAVFDTAFYHDLPAVAARYPLPEQPALDEQPRRYGFHGSAHRAMWRAWRAQRPDLAGSGRLITLQLGAGCSATAIADGRAVDTSMGFTPLEGLMMATRSGDVDPGLLIHLQRALGLDPDSLERLLNHDSGLAGVSGIGGDMRRLLDSDAPAAKLAIDMFCYRVRKYIGAYLAALGGADAVLFGGGVGENSPEVRARILRGLEGLGVVLDEQRNQACVGEAGCISAERSAVEIRVVEVDEAREIATAAREAVEEQPGKIRNSKSGT